MITVLRRYVGHMIDPPQRLKSGLKTIGGMGCCTKERVRTVIVPALLRDRRRRHQPVETATSGLRLTRPFRGPCAAARRPLR